MTFRITKDFALAYSHVLEGLAEGHKCGRVHGHNATVRVVLEADELDADGFVLDYGELAPVQRWLDDTLDHRHLNDVVTFQPSAEHLARFVYRWCLIEQWPVVEVGWSETPRTWAFYRP